MIDEKMIKLQHFFEADTRIKKEMLNSAPPNDEQYIDKESISEYVENTNDSLIYIFSELKCIASDIFGNDSSIMKRIIAMEQIIKDNFYSCGYDIDRLRMFYKSSISNMEMNFINSVKSECVGYTNCKEMSAIQKAITINEILHYMHSYVINNENILQSIPKIGEKTNDFKYPIVFRGYNVHVFEQLFEMFPNNMDVGWTDMVAISDRKMLMMVRDRGHALTIEISLNSQKARLEYFIPKLCNINMINNLPGINKVNENSIGATGVIETSIDDLSNTLFTFISRVPMDSDMNFKIK